MDLLTIIGMLITIYFLIYIILPWFLDCDFCLAFYEKFGKPISIDIYYILYIIIKDNDSCTYNIIETFLFLNI